MAYIRGTPLSLGFAMGLFCGVVLGYLWIANLSLSLVAVSVVLLVVMSIVAAWGFRRYRHRSPRENILTFVSSLLSTLPAPLMVLVLMEGRGMILPEWLLFSMVGLPILVGYECSEKRLFLLHLLLSVLYLGGTVGSFVMTA